MTTLGTTPWILGLTGGIGSGKSAAAQRLVELGVHRASSSGSAWAFCKRTATWTGLPCGS